jgi:hypothetical protein
MVHTRTRTHQQGKSCSTFVVSFSRGKDTNFLLVL